MININYILIGHNPGLNDLANFLLGSFEDNIATSGVLKIDFGYKLLKK